MFASINDCLSNYGAPKALKGGKTSGTLCLTDDGMCFSIKEKLDPSG